MRYMARTVALVGLALAGCATGGSSSSAAGELSPLLDSRWEPLPNQTCRMMAMPDWGVSPEVLIARDQARSALAQNEGEAGEDAPYAVLDVRFRDDGTRSRARVAEGNLAEPVEDDLLEAVAERLPEGAAGEGRGGGVLLRVEGAEPLEVTAGPVEYCACAIVNRGEVARILEQGARTLGNRGVPPGRYDFVVQVHSDAEGNILEKDFREATDLPEVNAMVAAGLARMEVAPPVWNRSPDPGWSEIPLTVVVPSPW